MTNWLSSTSVRINTNGGENPANPLLAVFGQHCLATGKTVNEGSVSVRGISSTHEKVLELLKSVNAQNVQNTYDFKGNVVSKCYAWEGGIILLNDRNDYGDNLRDVGDDPQADKTEIESVSLALTICATNGEVVRDFITTLKKLDNPPVDNKGKIYVLVNTHSGFGVQAIGMAGIPLERNNYRPDVIKDYDYIIENFQKPVPNGRIALLNGAPGNGKTYLVRGLLNDLPRTTFVVIPSNMVDHLASPEFMNFFLRYKNTLISPTVLVIEDADRCLVPRSSDNISVLSTLLNMTDGIVGHLLDIRVVATTNAMADALDPAISRPGRMLRRTTVNPLDPAHASEVYKRLTGNTKSFTDNMSLAEIYLHAKETNDTKIMVPVEVKKKAHFGFHN